MEWFDSTLPTIVRFPTEYSLKPTKQDVVAQKMETNKTKLTNAIMPIIGKSLTLLSERITEEYNKRLDYLADQNEKLTDRIVSVQSEYEQRIADLTAQLTEKGKAVESDKPKDKRVKKYGTDAIKHKEFDKIKSCVKNNHPIYLCGPAGSGKTQICEMVAESMGLDFYMTTKVDDQFGLVGYMDGNGKYNETAFYKCMKHGGLFLFDEIDASGSDAVVALNAAIANRYFMFPNGEMVYAHADFHVVACGNTYGVGATELYNGRQPLDASTIDRFGFIFVDYDERVELACAKGNRDAVQFVHDLRMAMQKAHICPFTISYRGITNLVSFEELFGTAEAVQMAITKGLDKDNVNIIYNNLYFRQNKYAKVFSNSSTSFANAV